MRGNNDMAQSAQQWLDEYRGRSTVGHYTDVDFRRALDALQAVLDLCDEQLEFPRHGEVHVDLVRAAVTGVLTDAT